jgi:integrase
MYSHLTDAHSTLVKKECHRWGTLVAMLTGGRVNEVAQLHVGDVRQVNDIWCIDFNEDADKTVKTAASARVVPIHDRLIEAGFLEFVTSRKDKASLRLFPEFPFTAQNGYGRNLGRWFNETFIPALQFDNDGLVFHSFRHSMVTLLGQADVPVTFVSAIVGHEQSGVTQQTYFNAGHTLEQLQRRINQFTF